MFSLVIALVGAIYHIHDRRLRALERWREDLTDEMPKTREHYLKEIALTYATKESFDRLDLTLAHHHRENTKRLDRIDSSLLTVVELSIILKGVKAEIGDHGTGLRGQVHEQRKHLVKLAGKVPGGLDVFD
jgi:hypothetical protein